MPCWLIVGGQWGDEGKGKIASYLALRDRPTIVSRAGLGPGAGHTVVCGGRVIKLRQLPSGVIARPRRVLIGAGCLVRSEVLLDECARFELTREFGVDRRATVVEASHAERDRGDPHLSEVIGSTGSGHGPSLADRAMRVAKVAGEVSSFEPYVTDVALELNEALDRKETVHVEGTNGFLLSVLYGTYPHTVGKDSTASTVAADVGIGPRRVDEVVLVFKAFPTRVGRGPFTTEMPESEASGRGFVEFGTVTGRRRRVGEFDWALAKEAARVNAPTQIAVTFLDRLDPEAAGKSFDALNSAARSFVDRVQAELGVPVTLLGTGADSLHVIDRTRMLEGPRP